MLLIYKVLLILNLSIRKLDNLWVKWLLEVTKIIWSKIFTILKLHIKCNKKEFIKLPKWKPTAAWTIRHWDWKIINIERKVNNNREGIKIEFYHKAQLYHLKCKLTKVWQFNHTHRPHHHKIVWTDTRKWIDQQMLPKWFNQISAAILTFHFQNSK